MRETLPYRLYLDEAVFADERRRLFAHQWVHVGRDEDLHRAGDWRRAEVAGEAILLVRGDDGVLRGFANTCRHRGAELCPADGPETGHTGRVLRCPYHHWTYGLDGALRAAPHLADVPQGVSLHAVGVAVWRGFVFACLHPQDTPPLTVQLGDTDEHTGNYPLDELRTGARLTYEVAANWKVIVENYNECYHCGPVHPELCELVPVFRRGGGADLPWDDGIPHRDGAWTFTATGTTSRSPFPALSETERVRHKGRLVYPNLLLSLSADHVAAFTLIPRAAGHTTVICDFLFAPDAVADPGFDPADAVEFWDLVNRQDWRIGESVQRGMSSFAAERGWFAPMEDDSADIAGWYRALMGDEDRRAGSTPVPEAGSGRLDADVAIVGLGGIGSATALFAARRGQRVLGLERFELGGHHRGASHDHSRIIRRSYHTEHYVRLTAGAYSAWREVERLGGEQCVWVTGGVDLFPSGAAIDATNYTSSMEAAGVPFDVVDGATVRQRWPSIAADDDVVGLVQAETGLVSPDRAVPLLQRLASGCGADLRGGSVVRELRSGDEHVELVVERTDPAASDTTDVVRAGTVVVAADAWSNELLRGVEGELPLTVLQEQVTYYDVADPAPFTIGRLPVWIWMDEPSFYGFPIFGRPGVKIAQDCGGTEVTVETRGFEPDAAILARTDEFARRFFGGRLGAASRTTTCLYTLTPDRDFVLDRVPGHPRVLVAQGAAHGFKFVAWFGRTLAALAAGATVEDDLSPFAFDRPALRQPTGATRWLV